MGVNENETPVVSGLRRILPYTGAALLLALLWSGWVFWQRSQQAREVERQGAENEARKKRGILDQLGGEKLTILSFYADPAVARRGERVRLCFGVSNATAVKIEPDVEPVTPALSRCLDVHPARSTDYVITAKGPKGDTASESLKVVVR